MRALRERYGQPSRVVPVVSSVLALGIPSPSFVSNIKSLSPTIGLETPRLKRAMQVMMGME